MNRVLFVVEEQEAVHWHDALRNCAGRWQMSFAPSAVDALAALERNSYDVVIVDILGAGIDGFALLAQVKAAHPDMARIVLSRPVEPAVAQRVLSVAHQFVAKPCEPALLWKVVERTCCMNGLVNNRAVRNVLGGLDCLPSVPPTYAALSRATANAEVNLGEIVAIVEKDTAMAGKVLQLVNSAFFGRPRRISSIPVTVSLLGLERLKALALCAHVFGMLSDAETRALGLQQLQERSLLTAQLARRFLSSRGRGEEGFTTGLLLNTGKIVLAVGLKDRYGTVLELARQRQVPVEVVERERFDVSHAEVGACLLGMWGLPVTIIEAVAFHHSPGAVLHDETALVDAVHVADALVDAMEAGRAPEPQSLALDAVVMSRDGMEEMVREWCAIAAEEVPAVVQ